MCPLPHAAAPARVDPAGGVDIKKIRAWKRRLLEGAIDMFTSNAERQRDQE